MKKLKEDERKRKKYVFLKKILDLKGDVINFDNKTIKICRKITSQHGMQEVFTMMESVTVGAKIRMTEAVTFDYPVGSTATTFYIDTPLPVNGLKAIPHICHFSKQNIEKLSEEHREYRPVFNSGRIGSLNQTDRDFLSARYRFAKANRI